MDYDTAKASLGDVNEDQIVLAKLLSAAAEQYVYGLSELMAYIGAPKDFAVSRIIDSVLLKTENVYGDITREEWIGVYDENTEMKSLIRDHPELTAPIRQAIAESHRAEPVETAPVHHEVGATLTPPIFGVDMGDLDAL